LLRAYFEGDGNVSVPRRVIRASSNSKELIDGLSLLLARFGIFSNKGRQSGQFTLGIPARYASAFRDCVGFESREKRAQLDRPVYDLSVPGLETFTTGEGVVTHNTMRTFHYAGVAEMNVTLGLPRLIEIVDARRVPSTPIMELFVKSGHTDLEKMRKIATEIEMTSLEDIASIETDLVNMRVLAYPDDHRMRSRGVTWPEIEEKMKKFGEV